MPGPNTKPNKKSLNRTNPNPNPPTLSFPAPRSSSPLLKPGGLGIGSCHSCTSYRMAIAIPPFSGTDVVSPAATPKPTLLSSVSISGVLASHFPLRRMPYIPTH
ncbi:hypothetical protein ACFX13_021617 [Malus domestica]